jgi:transcriptional regulator with XRE-family HTH domain
MFELGSSLRETRVRRGVELAQVAAETRIRMRYLQALEEERFELLPGSVYAMGFLRAYANYLDLDSQVFIDEYNARFRAEEAQPAPPQLDLRSRSPWPYGIAAIVFLLALGGALLAWPLTGSSPQPAGSHIASPAAARTPAATIREAATRPTRRAGEPAGAAVVLRATGGPCWLLVRQGSELGRQLFEGTLEPGESRRFGAVELWMRIGAPWNLVARRGGRWLSLPQTVATVLLTAHGIRIVGPA